MTPTKLAALNALTHILNGMAPADAADNAVDVLRLRNVAPDDVLALLWRKIRTPLEAGAHAYLESQGRGTGVYGLGHDLAGQWFGERDRRDQPHLEEYGEFVGQFAHDWFFHRAVALKVVA